MNSRSNGERHVVPVANAARPPVVVAVPTYKRVELLPTLVAAIRTELDASPDWDSRVVLVDNDPERSAEQLAAELGVDYAPEPLPGIAHARRRALREGDPNALVIMVDDDVVPEAGWFRGLVDVWLEQRPAAVMGYVRYVWPAGTEPWIAAGGFMARRKVATGTTLTSLATGNVLVDVAQVRALGVDFDVSMGFSGGEDTLFGMQIFERGGVIVASADSSVLDEIPLERTTREFVKQRTIGHGETRVIVDTHGTQGVKRNMLRVWMFGGGVARLVVFSGKRVAGLVSRDLEAASDGRRRIWFAIGRMRAAAGLRSEEYARTVDASDDE